MILQILKFLHLYVIAIWVGATVFFSLVAAPAIFKTLERTKAGEVVGAIFPVYWALGYISGFVSIVTLVVISKLQGVVLWERLMVLCIMTTIVLYNGLYLGKRARVIKAWIKALEGGVERERLRGAFMRLHARSSALNVVTIAFSVLLVYLTSLTF